MYSTYPWRVEVVRIHKSVELFPPATHVHATLQYRCVGEVAA
jgi:hypothetical protein